MCYSVMTQAYSEKEIPSSPNRSRTYDIPITSSDALPPSYRRLMGAEAIKLGSWDKYIDRFHSRDQQPCKFIVTKESFYIRKEFNSHRIGFTLQHGRRDVT